MNATTLSARVDVACEERRRCLLDHPAMYVEGAIARGAARHSTAPAPTPELQILIPLRGAFLWNLGTSRSLLTANHALFIAGGAESSDTFLDDRPVEALLLTPHIDVVSRVWGDEFAASLGRAVAASRAVCSPPGLQHVAAALWNLHRHAACAESSDLEEAAFVLLNAAAGAIVVAPDRLHARTNRLVGAVKELIGAGREPLSLAFIARQLRASPAYLTDLFRRSEGITIARYHRRLRLARALIELPHTQDITALALELGFSSHAHFSTAFRSVYGETPSRYRARMR